MNRFHRVLRCIAWLLVLMLSSPAIVLAAAPACPTIGVAPLSLPDGVIGSAYTQALSATTGNPPIAFTPSAFSVDSGVLPDGLAISAGQVSGTPTSTGSFTFAITASDAASCSGGRVYSVSIMCGSFSIAPPANAQVGVAYSQTLAVSGGVAPYNLALSASSPALPAGVTLASNGNLSGTPQPATSGSYALLIDVSDAASCSVTSVPVTLVVDEAPTITSAASTTFTVGTAGSFNVTTTGHPLPGLSEAGALPSGVTFNAGTGLLSGTPAAGTAGNYPITFTASNGVGAPAVQNFTLTVDEAPAITSANATSFTVGTAGTFTVTAAGSPAPTLSETGALPSGVTFNAGTGVLSGTPVAGTGGTYAITFTATNGVGSPATQNFTLTVDEAPAITSANTTVFTIGTAGTFTVTATGFPAPTLSQTGALPTGVTFNAATGVLSGTPAAGSGGSYALVFTATNGVGGPATQNFTLAVVDGALITSANATTFTVGAAGTFTVTATGSPTPVLSETGALPSGVTFNAGSGVLSGTPAAGTGGTYAITFTATNGVGAPATQNFTLTVDEAPAITSANTIAFTVGAAGTFSVTASGFPAPTLSQTGALPSGVTFNAATGVLSGTPAAGTGGSYPLVFTATNGIGVPATQNFTLAILAGAAITSPNATTFTVGVAGTFTVTATGSPTPTLSESGALPAGVTFNAGTGLLSGTPAAGTGGTYAITFTATNGVGAPATQNFTLTVNQAAAITSANTTTFTVGTAGSFTVTATGFPAPTLSESGALPTGVTFNAGTGVLSGTPAAGTGGSYPITFTATNGVGAPATQNFTLVVSQAPSITSVNATTFTVGAAGSFTVTATGSPAPALSESGALPTGVTFNAGTGVLSGTPAAGTGGTYPITFTATNGVGAPATQNFTLTVNQAAAITSANTTTFTVGTAGSFTVTATGFPAPTLSESGALPTGVTFNAGTGVLSGTPAAGTGGSYPITFTATNGVGAPATQNFTLVVSQPAAITSVNATTFTVGTLGSFTVTATGSPPPALSESGALPSGVTFNAGTGVLSGTPAAGTGGTYAITFTATNGVGAPATQNFTLTVNQAPQITSANSVSFAIGVPNTFTVTSTGFPAPTLSETGALPSGVTFNTGTGALAGTPGAGTAGVWPISFGANNGVGAPANQAFTLTVTCPTINVAGTLPNGLYGQPYGPQSFTQTNGIAPIAWSASGLPAGLGIAGATGVVSGTPTTTTNGVSVTVTATDAFQCTGTLTVNNLKISPVANADSYSTFGNTQLYAATAGPATPFVPSATNLITNDAGPGTLTPAVVVAPTHGVLSGFAAGAFIYTPTAGYSGPDTFTYTVTDSNGVASAPATVTITLGQVVWYVNGAGAAGDGRSASPFNSLVGASAAHAAGSMIFVESAGAPTSTPGAITVKANSTLWGQGTALPLAIQNTGATTKPLLTGTVTLGGNTVTVSSLDISSGASTGFTNTGTVTGAVVQNNVTVTTTTGTAVNLSNATGAFTFRSVSAGTAASGPTNGILLNGSSTLTVLGDASTNTCRTGNTACSGGTIQKTGGDAISLTNAKAVLSLMWIKNNANSGIKGTTVSKLALTDLLIQSNTNATGEQAGILINDLSDPAATGTRLEVTGSTEDNVRIHNSAVTGTIVFDACTVKDNSTASGNIGVFFQTNTTGNLTGTVKNSTLSGNRTIALRADAGDGSIVNATFNNNTIAVGAPNQGNQGIEVSRASTSTLTFNIDTNTITGSISTLINVFSGGGPGNATGDVKNNIVTGTGVGGNQIGIRVFNSGSAV
ncbi:MAG: putative Ig domain-containing protein, partial [Dokdonella sp.]